MKNLPATLFSVSSSSFRWLGPWLVASLLIAPFGCSDDGTAGDAATGGASGLGGAPASGSTPGAGGILSNSGGASPGSGGSTAAGGGPGPGGGFTTGGAFATGGASASGGAPSSGGLPGSGGTPGSGGANGGTPGTGGTASTKKFVGNITTGYQHAVDTGGRVFSTYWDQITPENAGKWGSVQSSASAGFNWAALDAIYDYAQRKGIVFKQHVFVWGAQQPSGTLTENHVRTWIRTFCARYPKTALIDVVNEPPPHTTPSYANAIGGGTNGSWQWIVNAFKWARESCPNAILILNDYNNVEYADQNQHFINIAKTVKAAGAPIDALGAQAHGLSRAGSANTMRNLLTKMHNDTGLPVYITEYDIDVSNDADQLARFKEHIPFFMETEWVHGVTLWGWIYGSTWVPASGLIRNGQPRPAMTWLMSELGRPAP